MPHPHGQIYAMPFLPPITQKEQAASREYAALHNGDCLFCRLLSKEQEAGVRIVARNDRFIAFVPFAARFPAEIGLYARRHVRTLFELADDERASLAEIISVIRKKYDNLYGFVMPLMMTVKQGPLREAEPPYHLHVQFLPLQRSPTKLKYLASIETAYGTFLADTAPEEMAENLRKCEPVTSN